MQLVKPDVSTICMGMAASAAALLLCGGAPKKRFALQYSRIMIHQPWIRSIGGQATDIDIHAREIVRTREVLNKIISQHTGQKLEKVEKDTERDYFMSSDEAKEYGIIDEIISKEMR